MSLDQQSLLQKFQNADEAALKELYNLYSSKIYKTASNITGDPVAASNITAETLTQLYRNRNIFHSIADVEVFLNVISRNECDKFLKGN